MDAGSFFHRHNKITRSLKKFILENQEKLTLEVFQSFLNTLSEELVSISAVLIREPRGPIRARKLHKLVEQEIAQETNISVSCKKGCSACCHMEVEITNYEAEILKELVEGGQHIDKARLQKQSTRELQDKLWKDPSQKAISQCVFLDISGSCGIYEHRPVMCRRHSVTSPAENCSTQDAKIIVRYFPRVDLLISAANEDPELEIGPLAKMLEIKLIN